MKRYLLIILLFYTFNSYAQRIETDYGDIYFEFFQFKEAIKHYDLALTDAKTPAKKQYLYEQLSQCYKYLFQYRKAEEYFKLLMNSGEEIKPEFYIDFANILKLNGKYEEAKKQFKKFQEVTNTELADSYLRSLNWAIRNADTIKNYDVYPTNLDISGQALGYCFYDDGLIYSHANNKPKLGNGQTQLFDLDYVRKNTNTEFQSDLKIMDLIQFDLNEGAPSVSSDGTVLYFSANASSVHPGKKKTVGGIEVGEEGISNFQIYAANSEGGMFQNPIPLNFNDGDYSFIHPCISSDGNTLFFSSNMPGGFGGFDLYKSIKEEGKWSEPVNMGKVVNSEENELFPWVSEGLFYFTSKGFNNYGGYDIFVAKLNRLLLPSSLKNLGQPINSFRDDVAFISKDGGRTGYFSSNRDNEEGADFVYYFDETIPKQDYAELISSKSDSIAVPILGSLSNNLQKIKEPGNIALGLAPIPIIVNGNEGTTKAESTIPPGAIASDKGSKSAGKAIIASVPIASNNPRLTPTIIPNLTSNVGKEDLLSKKFNTVQFKFNESTINASQMQSADSIVSILNANATLKVYVAAHADSRGSFEYNMKLTDRRAASVKQYLLSKGISSKRIITKGLGESQLLNNCADNIECTSAEHAINRRVEMKLVK